MSLEGEREGTRITSQGGRPGGDDGVGVETDGASRFRSRRRRWRQHCSLSLSLAVFSLLRRASSSLLFCWLRSGIEKAIIPCHEFERGDAHALLSLPAIVNRSRRRPPMQKITRKFGGKKGELGKKERESSSFLGVDTAQKGGGGGERERKRVPEPARPPPPFSLEEEEDGGEQPRENIT